MEGSQAVSGSDVSICLYLHQEAVEGKCLETNLFRIFVGRAQMLSLIGLAS